MTDEDRRRPIPAHRRRQPGARPVPAAAGRPRTARSTVTTCAARLPAAWP
ncbi:hypothetical protein HBB16_15910 [Pseudonocardia sp. MCCB 268]|nr:hypothetical protein [Pseudonocardia cytotoxica]